MESYLYTRSSCIVSSVGLVGCIGKTCQPTYMCLEHYKKLSKRFNCFVIETGLQRKFLICLLILDIWKSLKSTFCHWLNQYLWTWSLCKANCIPNTSEPVCHQSKGRHKKYQNSGSIFWISVNFSRHSHKAEKSGCLEKAN